MKRIRTENRNTKAEWDKVYGDPATRRLWTIWRGSPQLVELVTSAMPQGARVLHVGCGAGIALESISEVRPDLRWTGCDLSGQAIKYLREESPRRPVHALGGQDLAAGLHWDYVFQGDLTGRLPLADGQFDVVLCAEVLEHLEKPADAMAELVRLASKAVIVTVPDENATDTDYHLWSFSKTDLLAMIEPYGRAAVHRIGQTKKLLVGIVNLQNRNGTLES